MQLSQKFKNVFIEVASLLYILLFVYAAFNKILDFHNFQVQLGQSPLLSAFAAEVSYFIPFVEILIAIILALPRFRYLGLIAGFCLMVMFSVYIFIMLHFTPFVPCSCGGVLEKMNWNEHLIFNLAFTALAVVAVLLYPTKSDLGGKSLYRSRIWALALSLLISSGIIIALFLASEDIMHKRNNFTRRFPHQPIEFIRDYQLASIMPYIAGAGDEKVYIGDIRDPLKIIALEHAGESQVVFRISTDEPDRRFSQLRVIIQPPHFYLYDGIEAFAMIGKIEDWNAKIWMDKLAYYHLFVPIDSLRIGIRSVSSRSNEHMIGLMEHGNPGTVKFNRNLLDKQIDGFFDTDGKLLYNKKHDKLIYVYSYRNEYVLSDPALLSKTIGNTIDTITRAKIKVSYDHESKRSKIASPMRIVNKNAATKGDYLYVNSRIMGRFEEEEMWGQASIVDVYNIAKKEYRFSFYLYNKKGKRVSSFVVEDGMIYTLAGKTLSVYKLDFDTFEKN